jgi:flagellar protein FlbD
MISVTRLNGSSYYLNALLIESVEETPDTRITLVNGKMFLVRETAEEVVQLIRQYTLDIGFYAAAIKSQPPMEGTGS